MIAKMKKIIRNNARFGENARREIFIMESGNYEVKAV